jgi:hypothetical protein
MNTTDKTRQQLMATMRKTKSAAAGKTAAGSKAPRPANRTAKRTSKAVTTKLVKRPVKAEGTLRTGTRDLYQAGRRVWPD